MAGAGSNPERRPRNAYAVMDREGSGQAPDLHRKVDELQAALTQATKNIAALVTGLERSRDFQPGTAFPLSTVSTASSRGRFSHRARGNARAPPKIGPCSICHPLGHWERDCRRDRGPVPSGTGVKSVSCPYTTSPRIRIAANVNGKPVRCLVDSGCERIGRRLVPYAKLTPSR